MRCVRFLLVVPALTLLGCSLTAHFDSTPQYVIVTSTPASVAAQVATQPAPAVTMQPANPNMETHVSPIGFAFDYPKDWYFSNWPSGLGFRVTTFAPDNEPPHPLWTGAIAEVTFAQIEAGGVQLSLADWAVQWRNGLTNAGLQVLSENAVTLPSGLAAVRYDLVSGSGWEIHDLIFITRGQYVEVTARGDQGLIDAVVNTIRAV